MWINSILKVIYTYKNVKCDNFSYTYKITDNTEGLGAKGKGIKYRLAIIK